jgi:DNA-binding MarR family transcriptional regulator
MPRNKTSKSASKKPEVDRLIHEPARLNIMVCLYIVESGDFLYLKRETGLSWGNLSVQISKLESAGYVKITKEFVEKRPHTVASLTDKGRRAFEDYCTKMQQLVSI